PLLEDVGLAPGGAEGITSTRSSGNGNRAQALAARARAARQARSIALTRWRSLRWTWTPTWRVAAGLPCFVGRAVATRHGTDTRATASASAAPASANSEPTTA